MSKDKRGPSCFGLFVKSWLICTVVLCAIAAGGVALAIRFAGWSAQSWSDLSSWSSYPVMTAITVLALSTVISLGLSAFLSIASAFLGRGKGAASRSPAASKPSSRPQSQRKTTV